MNGQFCIQIVSKTCKAVSLILQILDHTCSYKYVTLNAFLSLQVNASQTAAFSDCINVFVDGDLRIL